MKLFSSGAKKPGTGPHPVFYIAAAVVVVIAAAICFFVVRASRYENIQTSLQWELGTGIPDAAEFLSDEAQPDAYLTYVTIMETLDISAPGQFDIKLLLNGKHKLNAQLVIADTTAPSATGVETTITVSETLGPDELIEGLKDASRVAVAWQTKPEFGTVGDYDAVISLTDESGNTATVRSTVHIRAVVGEVYMEAGGAAPEPTEFLLGDNPDAAFVTDMSAMTLNVPGSYDVTVTAAGMEYTTTLIVTDTIPPLAETQTLLISPGETADAAEFISSSDDATELTFTFAAEPDFELSGEQSVMIVVTDMGGNSIELPAKLIISDLQPVVIEMRGTAIAPEELVEDKKLYKTMSMKEPFTPDTVGIYAVTVILDGQEQLVIITVEDSTAPTAEAVDVSGFVGHTVTADAFVTNINDYSDVTVAFGKEPDWDSKGEKDVSIVLTDAAGNTAKLTAKLTLEQDTEPPAIYGVLDHYCYLDESVAYFAEVFAEDNCDAEVELTVDNANVDIHTAGTYSVTYSATDSAGNTARAECELTFIEDTVTDEELQELADSVLSEILTDDMDVSHQLLAVHDYVRGHITYNSYSDKTNWKVEAKRGIEEGLGDCYTFYAVAHLLLLQLDVDIMSVERLQKGTETMHFWHLVNDGTGWYHFDAFATQSGWRCYMRTSEETYGWSSYFWRYDDSLYPEVSTELYRLDSKGEER